MKVGCSDYIDWVIIRRRPDYIEITGIEIINWSVNHYNNAVKNNTDGDIALFQSTYLELFSRKRSDKT